MTEKLIIELDAKTSKLQAELDETNKKLDELDGNTEKADKGLFTMSGTSDIAAKSLGAVAAAAGVVITSITSLTKVTSEYAKEIKVASDLSGVAAEQLQLMAHATATVGIGIEQLGDISKDTREKIGDFLNTGGGGFQDFADAMKLTKEEARLMAAEFAELSGPEILQEMVSRMEDAEVSAVQMSHALEGMASDTTKLIPLLRDGGRELQALSDAMASVVVPLTDEDIDMFIKMGQSADLAAASLESLTNTVLLALGEAFIDTADKAAHFYASLNEGTQAQLASRLVEINEEISTLEEGMLNAESGWGRVWNTLTFNTQQEKFALEDINELLKEREDIQQQLAESSGLTLPASGGDDGESTTLGSVTPTADENAKAIEDLINRFKTEEELLTEKYEKEIELAANNKELLLQLENEYAENLLELDEEANTRTDEAYQMQLDKHQAFLDDKKKQEDKSAKEEKKRADEEVKLNQKTENQNRRTQDAGLASAMAINTALFEDNKAVRSGLIIADTAMAISRQFADLPYPAALASSAAIAANGVIQLAAVNSSSKGGGGSVSTPSSTGGATATEQASVTGEVEINESIGSGGQTSNTSNTVTITAEDGDDLAEAFASVMNKKIASGEITLG